MDIRGVLEKHGPLAVAVLVLAYILMQFQRDARQERADHTFILVEQMSALRHACDPKAP